MQYGKAGLVANQWGNEDVNTRSPTTQMMTQDNHSQDNQIFDFLVYLTC